MTFSTRKAITLGLLCGFSVAGLGCGSDTTEEGRPEHATLAVATDGKSDLPSWARLILHPQLACTSSPTPVLRNEIDGQFVGSDSAHAYRTWVDAGVETTLKFNASHSAARGAAIAVYDRNGDKVASQRHAYGNAAELTFTPAADGQVIVAVYSVAWYAWGSYTLGISCDGGSQSCVSDSQCSDGFCRCTDGNCSAKQCAPWSQEGEQCGGFVAPQHVTRCEPGLSCYGSVQLVDGPGTCVVGVQSIAQLLANPTQYDGHVVGLQGHLLNTLAACTEIACLPPATCCNSCFARQVLSDQPGSASPSGIELQDENGELYRCSGNECDFLQNCTAEAGARYRVVGKVTAPTSPFGVPRITVQWIEKQFLF